MPIGMETKNWKLLEWLIVAFLSIIVLSIGYRLWLLFQTDWSDLFSRLRPVDYLATVIILIILLLLRPWARSKP